MVESEAKGLSEEVMLGAVMYGHEQMQTAIDTINELASETGKPSWDWQAPEEDQELVSAVEAQAAAGFTAAYQISDKMERQAAVSDVKAAAIEALGGEGDDARWSGEELYGTLSKLEKNIVRQRVIKGEPRIDGRDHKTVRPINVDVGVMPRAHGSAVFTRGETQAIVVTTLGTGRPSRHPGGNAGPRRFRLRDSCRFRNHRVQRLEFDGFCLRHQPCADGCRGADQSAGGRRRHGPGQGRR
jgi:polyribonucleotide nucleotidyltransferase